jgi:hypothetical protein
MRLRNGQTINQDELSKDLIFDKKLNKIDDIEKIRRLDE